jgi:putative spermidine/putrescine transport system permease protein
MRTGPFVTALAILGYAFLLAPLTFVIAVSFNADAFLRFPPSGWSLRWYAAILENDGILEAMRNSAILATLVTVLALLTGLPMAWAIARGRTPAWMLNVATAPLLLPTLVIGLGLLLALTPFRLVATWPGLVLGHLVIVLPFVVRIMTTALLALPVHLESAAAAMGAPPLTVFLRVTLPLAAPGALASAALAFLLSFDETVISLFLVGPRLTTLPVELFRYTQSRTDPLVAALSVALIAVTLVVVFAVERLVGFTKTMGRS